MAPVEQPHQSDDQLRILHWNIHSWRDEAGASNLDAVATVIADTDPHVVSLVEVDESWGLPAALNEVASRLGYAWLFTPSFEFGHDGPAGAFGNALLTKLPIQAVQQWQLLWPPQVYDGTEPSEARSVVFAKLTWLSKSVWVGSTHLPRTDAGERNSALQRLGRLTEKLDEPWLVCGDFNTASSEWLDTDCSVQVCPRAAQPTYPTDRPVEAIDYCVASSGMVMEGNVLLADGSDHLPLLILVQVTAKNSCRPDVSYRDSS